MTRRVFCEMNYTWSNRCNIPFHAASAICSTCAIRLTIGEGIKYFWGSCACICYSAGSICDCWIHRCRVITPTLICGNCCCWSLGCCDVRTTYIIERSPCQVSVIIKNRLTSCRVSISASDRSPIKLNGRMTEAG